MKVPCKPLHLIDRDSDNDRDNFAPCKWCIRPMKSVFMCSFCMYAGILRLYQDVLLHLDFIHLAQFLTKLPENICSERLFRNIDCIIMLIDKRKFGQVLADNKEVKMADT